MHNNKNSLWGRKELEVLLSSLHKSNLGGTIILPTKTKTITYNKKSVKSVRIRPTYTYDNKKPRCNVSY
jgi:hypothetical protein